MKPFLIIGSSMIALVLFAAPQGSHSVYADPSDPIRTHNLVMEPPPDVQPLPPPAPPPAPAVVPVSAPPAPDPYASTAPEDPVTNAIFDALRRLHAPPDWAPYEHTLIMRESGGNQFSTNNWDSNAQAGDPSRGVTQVTGYNFDKYHCAGTSGDIYDLTANICASLQYIGQTYGDIRNVQQARPDLPSKGY